MPNVIYGINGKNIIYRYINVIGKYKEELKNLKESEIIYNWNFYLENPENFSVKYF